MDATAGFDDTKLDRVTESLRARAAATGGEVWREGDTFKIAIVGIRPEEIDTTIARLVGNPGGGDGLSFHEVLQVDEMKQLPELEPQLQGLHTSPSFEVDQRRPDEGGPLQTDYYLYGPSREDLEAIFADALSKGWKLPAGSHIAYEHVEPYDATKPDGYRSYVVSDEAELDGSYIASAVASYDPNTNRPIVLLDFDRDGARKFGDLTARIVGKKLATILGGEIRSAPIINGAIRGGRASITMGGADAAKQDREAQDLVEVLRVGTLPPGGKVGEYHYTPPSPNESRLWLARLLIALVGGGLVGLIAWLVLRWAAPVTRKRAVFAGPLPWQRILATLAAPASILIVARIPIYGVNMDGGPGFEAMFRQSSTLSIGALGIMPVITAAFIVELVALAVPSWRRRRHAGPVARFPITLASAVTAVLLIVIQGWGIAQYLGALEGTLAPGLMAKVLVIASLAGGTMILIAAAAIVRMYGLGNGYGALFASGWLIGMSHQLHGNPHRSSRLALSPSWSSRSRSRSSCAGACGATAARPAVTGVEHHPTLGCRRSRRVHRADRAVLDPGRHVQARGLGLASAGSPVHVDRPRDRARNRVVARVRAAVAVCGLREADLAGVGACDRVSVLVLAFIASIVALTVEVRPGVAWFVQPLTLGVGVAYVLDAYEDFLARRTKLVTVWTLTSRITSTRPKRVLADAGIPAHMSASNLRTLLAFFGPFVPIEVQVSPEHALAARDKLESLVV